MHTARKTRGVVIKKK